MVAKRYALFAIPAVVGVYVMLVKVALERRSIIRTALPVTLSGVILLSAFVSYPEGIDRGREERATLEKWAFVFSTYESQPDEALNELIRNRNGAERVREHARILQGLHYNVFSTEP